MFWRADFSALYTGFVMARAGLRAQLYDFDAQAPYMLAVLNGRSFPDGLPALVYPLQGRPGPIAASMVATRGRLLVWSLGQVVLLVWLLHRLVTIGQGWSRLE